MRAHGPILAIALSCAALWGGLLSAPQARASYAFEREFEGPTLGSPVGLAIDQTSGKVYLADTQKRVDVYEASGVEATPALLEDASFELPFGIAIDNTTEPSAGSIYVADLNGGDVHKFDAAGTVVTSGGGPFLTGFSEPWGVAVDPEGNIYVASLTEGTVKKYFSSGAPDPEAAIITGLSSPTSLATDSAGNLYAATSEGTFEYEASTGFTERKLIDEAGHTGVAVLTSGPSAGDVIVDEGGVLARYTPSGPGTWSLVEKFGEAQLNAGEGPGGYGVGINNTTQAVYVVDRPPNGEQVKAYIFHYTPPVPPVPPTVETEQAEGVTLTSAALKGSVNPGGAETRYFFEYGTVPCGETSCGTRTEESGPLTGRSSQPAELYIGKLLPGVTYSFWAVGVNEKGTVHGAPQTFTTKEATAPQEPPQEGTPPPVSVPGPYPGFPILTAIVPVPIPKISVPPKKTPPTRAQMLAKALRACGKKPHRQRAACVRQAHKRYGPVRKKRK
jgi:hypothetical protein